MHTLPTPEAFEDDGGLPFNISEQEAEEWLGLTYRTNTLWA